MICNIFTDSCLLLHDYGTAANSEFPKIADDDNSITANRGIHIIIIPVGPINSFHITSRHNLFSTPMGQCLVLPYSQDVIVSLSDKNRIEPASCLSGQSKIVNGIGTLFYSFCNLGLYMLCC